MAFLAVQARVLFKMVIKVKIILAVTLAVALLECAKAETAMDIPVGYYVLISKVLDNPDFVEYAAIKVTEEANNTNSQLFFKWIKLNSGESKVSVNTQNFKAGTKDLLSRFGIGFDGYRFSWEPFEELTHGRIKPILHGIEGVRYCLSNYPEVWGVDIPEAMKSLEGEGQCQGK